MAGVEAIDDPAEWVLVLACDLPDAPAAAGQLLAALPSAPREAEGLALRDEGGELQHLAAIYRRDALLRAAEEYGDPANRSVRGLMAKMALLPVEPGEASLQDLDTPEQLERWVEENPPKAPKDSLEDKESWRAFLDDACARLQVPREMVDEHLILRQSRRIARADARPMAPVGPYILGLALGRDDADPVALKQALEDAVDTAPIPEA